MRLLEADATGKAEGELPYIDLTPNEPQSAASLIHHLGDGGAVMDAIFAEFAAALAKRQARSAGKLTGRKVNAI